MSANSSLAIKNWICWNSYSYIHKGHFSFCALSQPIKTQISNLHTYLNMRKQIHTSRLQYTILTEGLTALCDTEHKRVKVSNPYFSDLWQLLAKDLQLSTQLLTAPLSQGNSTSIQSLKFTNKAERNLYVIQTYSNWGPLHT